MPQYMTIHRAPGLLKEQWVENAVGIYNAEGARFVQAYANLATGTIITIYEAENQATLEEQFEELGLPFEEINEVQLSQSFAEMEGMLKGMGKI